MTIMQLSRFPHQAMCGYQNIKTKKIVACVCCRDVSKTLPYLLHTFEQLHILCDTLSVIFYENDSTDDTLKILTEWCHINPYGSVISQVLNIPKFGRVRTVERIVYMSSIRNIIFDQVKVKYGNYDYMMCVESDMQPILMDNLVHAFSIDTSKWDVMSANGVVSCNNLIYYDIWSLIRYGEKTHRNGKNQTKYPLYKGGVQVYCAYGGLAFYKICPRLLNKCRYHPIFYNNGQCSTEHTGFHVDMYDNGLSKHYLDPSMVVVMQ